MNACVDCLPCLARNIVELAHRSSSGDAGLEARIAADGMHILADASEDGFRQPPACTARRLVDAALAASGGRVPDPWAEEKAVSADIARRMLDRLDELPGWDADSFESRLRLTVAGNIIDFSIYADLDVAAAMETMAASFSGPVDEAAVAALRERMEAARSILWIFDNCGEAAFDRLLLEPYRGKTTLAVRGKPVFNDVTRDDLVAHGYPEGWAAGGVVSNDDGVPGVVEETCGEAFRGAVAAADLVIAKGQANFETLEGRTDKPLALLFLAKCPVVCRRLGARPRTIQVLLRNFGSQLTVPG